MTEEARTNQQVAALAPANGSPDLPMRVTPSLARQSGPIAAPAGAAHRLALICSFLAALDGSNASSEMVSICRGVLDSCLDKPDHAIGWRCEDGDFSFQGWRGMPLAREAIPEELVSRLLAATRVTGALSSDASIRRVFTDICAETVASFPIATGGVLLGFIAFFDCDLQEGDLTLIELITGRMAARMMQVKREREHARQREIWSGLISLVNAVLRSESEEEVCRIILDGANELLSACQGAVPPADKSPVTLPPILNQELLGVLELCGCRANPVASREADLQLLTSFCDLASSLIERTREICRLKQLSFTDPLTGACNRRFFNARLEEEINRSRRQGLEFTVLFIDLDYFKRFNDCYGHFAGDEALKRISEIIKVSLRDMDVVARFGGEEFCVLLPGTSKRMGQLVAERIRKGIARYRFQGEQGSRGARLTASLGVASFPKDGTSAAALLGSSDIALYQAKARGRNRSVAALSAAAGDQHPHAAFVRRRRPEVVSAQPG